jgi:hypothetical protein
MEPIYVNGTKVEVIKSYVRNAYCLPHAYVLADGSYLRKHEGARQMNDEAIWVLRQADGDSLERVTVQLRHVRGTARASRKLFPVVRISLELNTGWIALLGAAVVGGALLLF